MKDDPSAIFQSGAGVDGKVQVPLVTGGFKLMDPSKLSEAFVSLGQINPVIELADDLIESKNYLELIKIFSPLILLALHKFGGSAKAIECARVVKELATISNEGWAIKVATRSESKVYNAMCHARNHLRLAGYLLGPKDGGAHGYWTMTPKVYTNASAWMDPKNWGEFSQECYEAFKKYNQKHHPPSKYKSVKDLDDLAPMLPKEYEAEEYELSLENSKMRAILSLNQYNKGERNNQKSDASHNLDENLLKIVIQEVGYKNCVITPRSGNVGCDVWGEWRNPNDPLIYDRRAFKMKNWSGKVGVDSVRKFIGVCAIHSCPGFFVAMNGIVDNALEELRQVRDRVKVRVIEGHELIEVMDQYNVWGKVAQQSGYESFREFIPKS